MDIDLTPYHILLINFSGGKDSSNILIETVKEAEKQNVRHRTGKSARSGRTSMTTICQSIRHTSNMAMIGFPVHYAYSPVTRICGMER